MVRQVIDPATWDRASWFAGMGERAAELIAQGADGDMLARFEAWANAWLAGQGVPNPPFRIIRDPPPLRLVLCEHCRRLMPCPDRIPWRRFTAPLGEDSL
jgi:hypothetical protein